MPITSIKDAVKAIAQSLQLSTIIPALILVIINLFIVFPHMPIEIDWSLSNDLIVTGVVFITVTFSYMLYAFNIPLIRIVEGHAKIETPILKHIINWWLHLGINLQRSHYKELLRRKNLYRSRVNKLRVLQEIDAYFPFPSSEDYILPTRLGNTIAAFEDYSYTRYGIDAIALWPRMLPLLQKNNYIEFISQQKAVFDFLLNLMFVVAVCGLELTFIASYKEQLDVAVFYFTGAVAIFYFLYIGLINSAVLWGTSVRVAFDLYRDELWKSFRLKPVSSFHEEKDRWKELSKLINESIECEIFQI